VLSTDSTDSTTTVAFLWHKLPSDSAAAGLFCKQTNPTTTSRPGGGLRQGLGLFCKHAKLPELRRCVSAQSHAQLPHATGLKTFEAAGSTYSIITTYQTWLASQQACRNLGMDLATFPSAAIFTEVHSKAKPLAGTPYWAGGSDQYNGASEGVWRWPSGWAFWPGNYSNWNTGDPNGNTVENCLEVIVSSSSNNGRWQDVPCTQTQPALCGPVTNGRHGDMFEHAAGYADRTGTNASWPDSQVAPRQSSSCSAAGGQHTDRPGCSCYWARPQASSSKPEPQKHLMSCHWHACLPPCSDWRQLAAPWPGLGPRSAPLSM
jgi:hypothetical protein